MSINPIDENATPKTTGSLEELFRHHLGPEAAVPPRPMLWDQIDNSLLVRQNELYRRRLAATRWVAAASLLLATLAGTGWWARRNTNLGGPAVATTTASRAAGTPAAAQSTAPANSPRLAASPGAAVRNSFPTTAAGTLAAESRLTRTTTPGNSAAPRPATTYAIAAIAATQNREAGRPSARAEYRRGLTLANESIAPGSRATDVVSIAAVANGSGNEAAPANYAAIVAARRADEEATKNLPALGTALGSPLAAAGEAAAPAAPSLLPATGQELAGAEAGTGAGASAPGMAVTAAAPGQVGLLAVRPAALALTAAATLPGGLATLPVDASAALPAAARPWTYGASYTAGIFNPNINFSRAGIEPAYDYSRNAALGPNSPALTEAAAAQYRENLRAGFSQRLALLATRHLRGHWLLSTGAEFAQATARSASSASFVGEQLYDLGTASRGTLHTTEFRYRMASVPAEVRYANPAKPGWSFYGRLGGVVSGLLGVRSEVSGEPEATRTYSVASAGSPYRRVLANVRGGAGAQFRPATGNWALTMGPVAEVGLLSLNAHPAQPYLAQSRPYSFGMEAGIAFGR